MSRFLIKATGETIVAHTFTVDADGAIFVHARDPDREYAATELEPMDENAHAMIAQAMETAAWDRQIAEDIAAGRLDGLTEEALRDVILAAVRSALRDCIRLLRATRLRCQCITTNGGTCEQCCKIKACEDAGERVVRGETP